MTRLILALLLCALCAPADELQGLHGRKRKRSKVVWEKNLAVALKKARETKRPLFLFVGADWCPHAARVRHVYCGRNREVRRILGDFVCVKFLGEDARRMLAYLGGTGYPDILCLTHEGEQIFRARGVPTLAELIEALKNAKRKNDGLAITVADLSGENSAPKDDSGQPQVDSPMGGGRKAKRASRAWSQDRVTLLAAENGKVVVQRGKLSLGLDSNHLSIAWAKLPSGGLVRFTEDESGKSIKQVVHANGQLAGIDWFYPVGKTAKSDRKMQAIRLRPATEQEMKAVGMKWPEGGPAKEVRTHAWICAYSPDGNLTEVRETENGKEIKKIVLSYDDRGRITVMSHGQRTLAFEYNANGKPVKIALTEAGKPLGAMLISYDQNGEITKVRTDPADAGHKLALRVTQSFQTLMAAVKPFGQFTRRYHLYY